MISPARRLLNAAPMSKLALVLLVLPACMAPSSASDSVDDALRTRVVHYGVPRDVHWTEAPADGLVQFHGLAGDQVRFEVDSYGDGLPLAQLLDSKHNQIAYGDRPEDHDWTFVWSEGRATLPADGTYYVAFTDENLAPSDYTVNVTAEIRTPGNWCLEVAGLDLLGQLGCPVGTLCAPVSHGSTLFACTPQSSLKTCTRASQCGGGYCDQTAVNGAPSSKVKVCTH
jgi:hypothetical protein